MVATVTLEDELSRVSEKDYDYSASKVTANQFDLLRSFALTSLIVMLLIGGLSGFVFSQYIADSLIRRDAEVSGAFLHSLTEVEGGPDIFRPGLRNTEPGLQPSYDLPELTEHIATMPAVVRTNIYSSDRTILWSTQPGLVGKRFSENHELEKALQGDIVFELKNIQEENKAEYADFAIETPYLVENYLPIKDQYGSVVAVVEIYKASKSLFAEIESARNLVWVSVVSATLFLYVSLFWIIYRANGVIRSQQSLLVETETMVAVGEMASAVAHSIRNPLAVIRSSAEFATETSNDPLVKEASEDIITQTDRVELWLRELLIYSRPQGATQFNIADLAEIVSLCLKGHEKVIKSNNIELQAEIDDQVPIVRGDPALLGQMFNSLLDNALDAMPRGGQLTVRVLEPDGVAGVQVQIIDSGVGIPEDRLETMFESSLTTKKYGLGFGMLLVKRAIDRHGGKISLSSRVDAGTAVTCVFPL